MAAQCSDRYIIIIYCVFIVQKIKLHILCYIKKKKDVNKLRCI